MRVVHTRLLAFIALLSIFGVAAPSYVSAAVSGCETAGTYVPFAEPEREPTVPASDLSIILVHGKNSWPLSTNFDNTAAGLAALGYTVIRPFLPWGRKRDSNGDWVFEWDGTQCQGLNYLHDLVQAEHERGMRVVMMGHSMGGMHTMLYASKPEHGLEGIFSIAPSHILPFSKTVVRMTAADVERARAKVIQGLGDEPGVYSTWYGELLPLQTTPNNYLSYHDTTVTPDFNDVLPAIALPWYLLVGTSDPIYGFYERAGIIDKLPSGESNEYRITAGDHRTVLQQVPDLFDTWFRSWSTVGEPPAASRDELRILLILQQLLLD